MERVRRGACARGLRDTARVRAAARGFRLVWESEHVSCPHRFQWRRQGQQHQRGKRFGAVRGRLRDHSHSPERRGHRQRVLAHGARDRGERKAHGPGVQPSRPYPRAAGLRRDQHAHRGREPSGLHVERDPVQHMERQEVRRLEQVAGQARGRARARLPAVPHRRCPAIDGRILPRLKEHGRGAKVPHLSRDRPRTAGTAQAGDRQTDTKEPFPARLHVG